MINKAMYPGTFDPLTYGHLDIINRASKIFDQIFLAIAENSQKNPLFSLKERIFFARKATENFSNVIVFGFNGLTVNIIKEKKVNVVIRGLRTISDFEYETRLLKINHYFFPEVETIFMISTNVWAALSSKLVKDIAQCGGAIHGFMPSFIAEKVIEKLYVPSLKNNNI